MKKNLLLITNRFPFGESERGFLEVEFQHLTEEFQVHVLANTQEPLLYPLPEGVKAECYEYSPVFRPRRLKDLPSFLQLLIQPFRPSVFSELRRALRRCPSGQARARVQSILSYSVSAWQLEKRLRKIVEAWGTDLIYSYWCTQATLAAVRVKKRCPDLKVVTRFHGYDLYRERRPDGWQPFRQEISQGCDCLIFVSETGRRYYLETWGRHLEEKCELRYLGSRAMNSVRASSSGLTLVSCADFIPIKRVGLIIDALALLPDTVHVEWHHVGSGSQRDRLAAYAEKTLPPHVRWKFWGHIPNTRLDGLYQTIRPGLFITTSSTEGLPISILEAFSACVPAVATAVGGIPEIVRDGETGYLLPENPTPEEAAAAIRRFYDLPPAEKESMGSAARTLWEESFDAKKNAECLAGLFKGLLST